MSTLVGALLLASAGTMTAAPVHAGADFSVSGKLAYTGSLGPVSGGAPLCLCIYTNPELTSLIGCLIKTSNNTTYRINAPRAMEYYLIAFLDLHVNERVDPDEPYEIFRDRATTPADVVFTADAASDIDLVFGDENLPGAPTPTSVATATPADTSTPTPSETPTPTEEPTATEVPTASVTPTVTATPMAPCAVGDCDGGGTVTVDEILTMVNIALGLVDLEACEAGDANGDQAVQVDEIVRSIQLALGGCE